MHPTGNLIADANCRTAELGLTITGAANPGPVTIIHADPVNQAGNLPGCRVPEIKREHVGRRLVDLPVVGFPTRAYVRVPRFTCTNPACGRKIFQTSLPCADNGAKLIHRVTRWILERPAVDRMSVAETPKALGVGSELVNKVTVTHYSEPSLR